MTKKRILNIRTVTDGVPGQEEVDAFVLRQKFCGYTFFIYKSYKTGDKEWVITEYETGGRVDSVKYKYEATNQIESILERVGADKFRKTIEEKKAAFGTVNKLP